MDRKVVVDALCQKKMTMNGLPGNPVNGIQPWNAQTSEQMISTSSGGSMDPVGHASSLLMSDLCNLTGKFDSDSLIKVDSMLSQPCQYLGEVPVSDFDVDTNTDVHCNDIPIGNEELSERMAILDTSSLSAPLELQEGQRENGGAINDGVIAQVSGDKDEKMELLDTVPFLVSEEGVVFQCFPLSEKEVFLVTLNDQTLVTNDQPTNQMSLMLPQSQGSTLNPFENSCTKLAKAGPEEELPPPVIPLEMALPSNSIPNVSSSMAVSGDGGSGDQGSFSRSLEDQADLNKPLLQQPFLSISSVPDGSVENAVDNNVSLNRKRKLSDLSLEDEVDDNSRKELKITHATVYAPVQRKSTKSSTSDTDKQSVSEWFKCSVCSLVLPSAATLRHHLVKCHQEKDIRSVQCFLCQQECWSKSQEEWHLRLQHGIKNKALACPVCGAQLHTPAECRAHVRKHPATLVCPSCNDKFAAHHQLVAHIKLHIAEFRPHSCQECDARFSQKSSLGVHFWRHSPQKCSQEACEHMAEDESWLMVHLQHEHSMTAVQVRKLVATRDAADHKMDSLLSRYSLCSGTALQDTDASSFLTTFQGILSNLDKKPFEVADPDKLAFTLDEEEEEEEEEVVADVNKIESKIVQNVVHSLVETVASAEDEEKQGLKTEEESLLRIMSEEPSHFRCGLCNMYLSSPEELATHKAGHNKVIECTRCEKSFLSVKQLKRHMTVHSTHDLDKNKVYPEHRCQECGKSFGSESALSRHRSTHARSLGRHQCTVCKRRIRTRHHLVEHMARVHKIHHDSKKQLCPICDRKFISKTHLEAHLVTHGEREPRWSCDRCGRSYIRPRSLQRHMATHDKKYACTDCDETFESAHRLAVHSRTHDPTLKTRLTCSKCSLTFAYQSHLQVHMRIHTGEKPYVCETCGKCFRRLQQCNLHHRMIHGDGSDKEACVECSKVFSDKTNLLRHRLMVHYHLKRWVCGMCARSYAYSQDLRSHLQKHHDLEFDRLSGSTKKSIYEIYVIPEIGSQELSSSVQASVEAVCGLERQKVQLVLRGLTGPQKKLQKLGTVDECDDPDNPEPLKDGAAGRPFLLPAPVLRPPLVDNGLVDNSHFKSVSEGNNHNAQSVVVNEPQAVLQLSVTCIKCSECGVDVVTPFRCGACGIVTCSVSHRDSHVASVHQVLFQCSVCGLHYSSQAECIAHVTSAHSSHLLAMQGSTSTYLPVQPPPPPPAPPPPPPPPLQHPPQPLPQAMQVHQGTLPSQVCVPLAHAPTGSQCLLQVGGHPPQFPVVMAPTTTNVATHKPNSTNYIVQYPQVVIPPPTNHQDKQSILSVSDNNQSQPQTLWKSDERTAVAVANKFEKSSDTLCGLNFTSNKRGDLAPPAEENLVLALSSRQNTTLPIPSIFPSYNAVNEESVCLVGTPLRGQQEDNHPVLLVGSLPVKQQSVSSSTLMPQSKMSVAVSKELDIPGGSFILPPPGESAHQEQSPAALLSRSLPMKRELKETHPNASSVAAVDTLPLQKAKDAESSLDENTSLLQTLVTPSAPAAATQDSLPPTSPLTVDNNSQVSGDNVDRSAPQEVSVEIIQTRPQRKRGRRQPKSSQQKENTETSQDTEESNNPSTDIIHECSTCGKTFTSALRLKRHKHTRNSQKFPCSVCSKVFAEKANLKTHMLMHTLDRPHSCSECEKTFRYMRDLKEHKHLHEGTRPHACHVCQRRFVRWRELSRHLKEQHSTERHQCKICGSSFKRKLYLESVHMKVHQSQTEKDIKPEPESTTENKEPKQFHSCRVCGRSFAQVRYLTGHLRTHSKRAEYVRCPKCPRMFTSERTQKVHTEAFHDREVPKSSRKKNSQVVFYYKNNSQVTLVPKPSSNYLEQPQLPAEGIRGSVIESLEPNTPERANIPQHSLSTHLETLSSGIQNQLLPGTSQLVSVDETMYGSALVRNNEVDASSQGDGLVPFAVQMADCSSITYLAPTLSS